MQLLAAHLLVVLQLYIYVFSHFGKCRSAIAFPEEVTLPNLQSSFIRVPTAAYARCAVLTQC